MARTILVTSPKRERYKEFAKLGYVRMVYMPLWDEKELLKLHKSEFAKIPGLPLEEFFRKIADTSYPYGSASGTAIHMVCNENYAYVRPQFASEYIENKFTNHLGSQRFSKITKFLKDTAHDSAFAASRGFYFEL